MDRSWNQLVERCNLFYDAPSGLYRELLKEAEVELANKCSLFKQHYTILFRDNEKLNAFKMPSTFKSMISVFINGREIPHKEKSDWSFTSNSSGPMKVQEGTPNYYTLGNSFIVFDKVPTSGSADLYFRGNLQNHDNISKSVLLSPSLNGQGNDWVYIDTSMGDQINGLDVKYLEGNVINTLTNITVNSSADLDDSDPLDLSQSVSYGVAVANDQKDVNFQLYQGDDDWSSQGLSNEYYVRTGIIKNYRTKGPVIENDYHLNLCDYAIYMASAKKDLELSIKHLQIWEQRLAEILNDNIDKELPMGMKEEI